MRVVAALVAVLTIATYLFLGGVASQPSPWDAIFTQIEESITKLEEDPSHRWQAYQMLGFDYRLNETLKIFATTLDEILTPEQWEGTGLSPDLPLTFLVVRIENMTGANLTMPQVRDLLLIDGDGNRYSPLASDDPYWKTLGLTRPQTKPFPLHHTAAGSLKRQSTEYLVLAFPAVEEIAELHLSNHEFYSVTINWVFRSVSISRYPETFTFELDFTGKKQVAQERWDHYLGVNVVEANTVEATFQLENHTNKPIKTLYLGMKYKVDGLREFIEPFRWEEEIIGGDDGSLRAITAILGPYNFHFAMEDLEVSIVEIIFEDETRLIFPSPVYLPVEKAS